MLRKQYCTVEKATQLDKTLPLVVRVSSPQDLDAAFGLLKTHSHPLRGIEISQHLLKQYQPSVPSLVTYLRIQVHDLLSMPSLLRSVALKKRFLEVFIDASCLQENSVLLENGEQAHRIVIKLDDQWDLATYEKLFAQFLLLSRYPLFTGAPFCVIAPEHCYEFFDQLNTIVPPKPSACTGCLFVTHCPFNGKNFVPKPLTDIKKYNDALMFLNLEQTTQNENPAPRF